MESLPVRAAWIEIALEAEIMERDKVAAREGGVD